MPGNYYQPVVYGLCTTRVYSEQSICSYRDYRQGPTLTTIPCSWGIAVPVGMLMASLPMLKAGYCLPQGSTVAYRRL
jgi:hypothetical protein